MLRTTAASQGTDDEAATSKQGQQANDTNRRFDSWYIGTIVNITFSNGGTSTWRSRCAQPSGWTASPYRIRSTWTLATDVLYLGGDSPCAFGGVRGGIATFDSAGTVKAARFGGILPASKFQHNLWC